MSDFNWAPWLGEDYDAPQWKPEHPKDKVVGVLTHVEVKDTKFGSRPMLILDTDDGPRKVWVSSVGLQRALAEKNPQVGDKVGILFTHEEDVGSGNPMKCFNVKVEHAAKPTADDDSDPF